APPVHPPNRTVTPRATSYAIAWPRLAGGPVIARRVQAAPFHSQVSPGLKVSLPPKSSVVPDAALYATACPTEADGPLPTGACLSRCAGPVSTRPLPVSACHSLL